MIIVHGQTRKTHTLGVAAAGCVNCRSVRPHIIEETRLHHTLYFQPVGPGKPLATEARCSVCGRRYRADPAEFAAFVPAGDAAEVPIDQLAERTNPDASADLDRLLSFHERAKTGDLLPEDRIDLIVHAIFALEVRLQKRMSRTNVDWISALLILSTFVLIVGGVILMADPDPAMNTLGFAMFLGGVGSAFGMIWRFRTDVHRHIQHKHWRPLVAELKQFMPGTGEIEFAFGRLERMHARCIRHLPWQQLAKEVWADPALATQQGV